MADKRLLLVKKLSVPGFNFAVAASKRIFSYFAPTILLSL